MLFVISPQIKNMFRSLYQSSIPDGKEYIHFAISNSSKSNQGWNDQNNKQLQGSMK